MNTVIGETKIKYNILGIVFVTKWLIVIYLIFKKLNEYILQYLLGDTGKFFLMHFL